MTLRNISGPYRISVIQRDYILNQLPKEAIKAEFLFVDYKDREALVSYKLNDGTEREQIVSLRN